jgi:hypothetical protein
MKRNMFKARLFVEYSLSWVQKKHKWNSNGHLHTCSSGKWKRIYISKRTYQVQVSPEWMNLSQWGHFGGYMKPLAVQSSKFNQTRKQIRKNNSSNNLDDHCSMTPWMYQIQAALYIQTGYALPIFNVRLSSQLFIVDLLALIYVCWRPHGPGFLIRLKYCTCM